MLSENAADIQLDSRSALFSQECDTTFGSKTEVATAIIINAENGTGNRYVFMVPFSLQSS
jgi:hypothetical protein